MSRKDYEAIAAMLASNREAFGDELLANGSLSAWEGAERALNSVTKELADILSAGNPRFDRSRFYRAAGYTS